MPPTPSSPTPYVWPSIDAAAPARAPGAFVAMGERGPGAGFEALGGGAPSAELVMGAREREEEARARGWAEGLAAGQEEGRLATKAAETLAGEAMRERAAALKQLEEQRGFSRACADKLVEELLLLIGEGRLTLDPAFWRQARDALRERLESPGRMELWASPASRQGIAEALCGGGDEEVGPKVGSDASLGDHELMATDGSTTWSIGLNEAARALAALLRSQQ